MTEAPPTLRPDVLRREVEDELLLYSPDSGETLLLNATAAAIVELCDGTRSSGDIADVIVECIPEAGKPSVLADIDQTLTALRKVGMLL